VSRPRRAARGRLAPSTWIGATHDELPFELDLDPETLALGDVAGLGETARLAAHSMVEGLDGMDQWL
jgi:hypothetical protein